MKALTCLLAPSLPSCPFLIQPGSLVLCGKEDMAYMQDRIQRPKSALATQSQGKSLPETVFKDTKRKRKLTHRADKASSILPPHHLEALTLPSHTPTHTPQIYDTLLAHIFASPHTHTLIRAGATNSLETNLFSPEKWRLSQAQ